MRSLSDKFDLGLISDQLISRPWNDQPAKAPAEERGEEEKRVRNRLKTLNRDRRYRERALPEDEHAEDRPSKRLRTEFLEVYLQSLEKAMVAKLKKEVPYIT